MTFLAASIFVYGSDDIASALSRASRAVELGAALIEWRVDVLGEDPDGPALVADLVRQSPAPCIVTCRPAWEGGSYQGDDATRVSLFESLSQTQDQPRYIDVELAAWQRSANLKQKIKLAVEHDEQPRDVNTGLILSAHDFDSRPRDLIQRVEAMSADPDCRVMKIAWQARSLRDNLEAFDLLHQRTRPMIALCMGQFGLMSRVLAPKFGGFLTFASVADDETTALGQPTIETLRKLYRFDDIGPKTSVYGVIGWPVEHSRSPELHNAGFNAVGHDGVMLPMPIPTEYEHFKATVGEFVDHPRLDFRGAAVTLPHKENLLRFVQERGGRVDELAQRIGAANTLIVGSAGATACTNTDAPVVIESLCTAMSIDPKDLGELRVAVLGVGGVARAVVGGLAQHGAEVVLFNRSVDRAKALVNDFDGWESNGKKTTVSMGESAMLQHPHFHIIINCTPLGMAGGPDPDTSPLDHFADKKAFLDDRVTMLDTVYTPVKTPMLVDAEARGARIIPGLDMFLRQANQQFKLWTGMDIPATINSDWSKLTS